MASAKAAYHILDGLKSVSYTHLDVYKRQKQIRAAGFNAFRDAHQPHHLDYQKYWDKEGMLWWTQFSAHVWYDTCLLYTSV